MPKGFAKCIGAESESMERLMAAKQITPRQKNVFGGALIARARMSAGFMSEALVAANMDYSSLGERVPRTLALIGIPMKYTKVLFQRVYWSCIRVTCQDA
jgi:hypothetical protein